MDIIIFDNSIIWTYPYTLIVYSNIYILSSPRPPKCPFACLTIAQPCSIIISYSILSITHYKEC